MESPLEILTPRKPGHEVPRHWPDEVKAHVVSDSLRPPELTGLPKLLAAKLLVHPPVPHKRYGGRVDAIDNRGIPKSDPILLSNPLLDISVGLFFCRRHLNKLAIRRALPIRCVCAWH
ncbi:hypothetical protein RvVAT039_pl09780 (plasmid) [Agrobacterium vitis]|nr:hypothetical protein RvVAT039_pl09780 [Agrobacterium vitis]